MSFYGAIIETYCHSREVLLRKTRWFLETNKEIAFFFLIITIKEENWKVEFTGQGK